MGGGCKGRRLRGRGCNRSFCRDTAAYKLRITGSNSRCGKFLQDENENSMCRLVSYSYSRKGGRRGGFISVPGPLLLPVSYVASIWGGATSLFRRRLNQQLSRLSVRAPRGFAHRCFYSSRISSSTPQSACFHSVSKEMREFSKCVFLVFSKPFFSFPFFFFK